MNPELTPLEIRRILMGTVDQTPELREKIRSGGSINPQRAIRAVRYFRSGLNLNDALDQARLDVVGLPTRWNQELDPLNSDFMLRELSESAGGH